jgi:hypothetical protein
VSERKTASVVEKCILRDYACFSIFVKNGYGLEMSTFGSVWFEGMREQV